MDADAIGGSINLVTKRAPEQQIFSVESAPGYGQIREEFSGKSAFTYGNRFADGKLGLLLGGSINRRDFGSDNIELEYDFNDTKDLSDDGLKELQVRHYTLSRERSGDSGSYLWQYKLEVNPAGKIEFVKVREFGQFSGLNAVGDGEVEAIAVDDELGFVYYSDELFGIRKYHADPDAKNANVQLAVFGKVGFADDREGISIYKKDGGEGYILVSDQGANEFHVFTRQGTSDESHYHELVKIIPTSTMSSDGSEVSSATFGEKFPGGLFVAMSDDKTFQFYAWQELFGEEFSKQ